MAVRNVMIEIRRRPELEASFFAAGVIGKDAVSFANAMVAPVPGLTLDLSFPPVSVPALAGDAPTVTGMAEAEAPDGKADEQQAKSPPVSEVMPLSDFDEGTVILRGTLDESAFNVNMFAAGPLDGLQAVYADPLIEPCITCGGSPPLGSAADVARLLDVGGLRRAGLDGSGVLLAIVDTGVNLAHLRGLGLQPSFSEERSWVPPLQPGQQPLRPGQMPVGHGTMCAFDALIAAPRATLVDVAVLASRRPGGSAMDGLLSDAVLGYSHLIRLMRSLGRPGDFHSLVVSNSWGMFQPSWDFPPGHPGNYSDNPAHPFNRIVATLERAGADILFAAGNCGRECPDSRCGTAGDAGIFGANSHPSVLCVAGVDVRRERVGYSTRGPGRLDAKKPDIAGYTHFLGSRVYPADGGTSAATPVVAGLFAACRSRFANGTDRTPAMLRDLVRQTADGVGAPGFDMETGFGVVNGTQLARCTLAAHNTSGGPSANGTDEPVDTEGFGIVPVDDQAFLEALRAFTPGAARGAGAKAGCCASCAEKRPPDGGKETIMSSNDQEFMQALQQFGGVEGFGPTSAGSGGGEFGAGFGAAGDFGGGGGGGGGDAFGSDDGGDAEFMQALQAYGGAAGMGMAAGGGLGAGAGGFGGVDAAAAPSLADVCRTWKSVRPIVLRILPFLAALPGIGAPVAAAFKTLGTLLDAVCGGGGGGAAGLCQRWRQSLRAIVVRVASVVGHIPLIGSAAAKALRALIAAIDAVCRGA